jgi:hypothetical protein
MYGKQTIKFTSYGLCHLHISQQQMSLLGTRWFAAEKLLEHCIRYFVQDITVRHQGLWKCTEYSARSQIHVTRIPTDQEVTAVKNTQAYCSIGTQNTTTSSERITRQVH